jgi:P pilus assembly chaperone PapD
MLPLSCVLIAAAVSPLRAQLTVSQLEITVTPSATGRVIASFDVRNAGKVAAQAILTREDWDRAENGENRFAASGSKGTSCGALVSVFPMSLRIEAGATQAVRVAVESAQNLSKECWDIIFVEEQQQKSAATRSALQYILRTGVKLYVVPNGLKRDAAITGMSVEKVSRRSARTSTAGASAAKQRIAVLFNDEGQLHLAAKGRVEIRRLDNSLAATIPVPEFPTLPGAVRRLELDVPTSLAPGSYVALALIDFGGTEIAAGQLELTVP